MAKRERHGIVGAWVLGLGLSTGCYSGIQALDDNGGISDGEDAGEDEGEGEGDDGLGPVEEMPAPTTRFFRLTHQQWENTVQDLFYLDEPTGLSSELRADPLVGGFMFDNNALSLEVDQALWSGYQRAGVQMAEIAVNDAAILAAIAPESADEAARAADFIRDFGFRAFRRPLTDTEFTDYQDLFDSGASLYTETTGFEAGARLVLEAMLQSPYFLYRVEASEEIVQEVIPLGSWEVASRMSYFLWDSMPDTELFDAAAADELGDAEQVEAQARRMLDDPKAEAVVQHFHDQMLEVERFLSVSPAPVFYPDAPEDLGELATWEYEMFLGYTIFDQGGSWRDLLTSTETFVNDDLAAIYGVAGSFGDDFERVDLDPAERRGLFTQIGFLAGHATSVNADPIIRGAFVARIIACHTIAAPPDSVPPVPMPDADATNRETVIAHTEAPGSTCLSCHKPLINPFGFPFENYDSTGAFQTVDNGQTIDAKTTVILADGTVEVDGALDLASALAEDERVHQCYMEHWLEFAMGRPYDAMDDPLVERLATDSLDDVGVKELLVSFAISRPFLTRATEEMQ